MGLYKTHVVQKGETLQDIATQQLKDVTRWSELIALNQLVYPYIVNTNEEKLKNVEHLLAPGDRIKLPEGNSINDMNMNYYAKSELADIYDMSMGMDIGMEIYSGDYQNGAIDDLAFMYPDSKNQDLAVAKGVQNLKQSIQMRLMTQYGTLPYHPTYGTHLLSIIGEVLNEDTVERIKIEIVRTAKTDKRVVDAKIAYWEVSKGNDFLCQLNITPRDAENEFILFVDLANSGSMRFG